MHTNPRIDKKELILPDLSYKLVGILYATHNELGRYRNEKQYCDRIGWYLKEFGIQYEREKIIPVSFEGEEKRRNVADFMIDGKIILEIKAKRFISKEDYFQVKRYLTSSGKRLGIIANFRQKYLAPRRILEGYV